ncbi:MAG: cytochrome c oxidase assembly protein [Sphingomonas sp.]
MSEAQFFVAAAIPVVGVGFLYAEGARRRADVGHPVSRMRHIAFASGLLLFLMSVEWPFETWAHKLFYLHQVGFMVARIVAPMLLAASRPIGLLVAGLPHTKPRQILREALQDTTHRKIWRTIRHPVSVLAIYIGVFYVWEIPDMQAAALAFPSVGYVMHFSLLLAGLLFWGRILDRRPSPHGLSHGGRLMMIWLAVLTQIPFGAYITLKSTVLYSAYDTGSRLGMIAPLADESRGGFFIWMPSVYLSLLGLLVVVHKWGLHETLMDLKRTRWSSSNSAILLYPQTGRALREMARGKNRRMAIGMVGFAVLVFSAVMTIAIGTHRLNRRENLRQYTLSRF